MKKKIRLATTFTYDQVKTFIALMQAMEKGQDTSILLRRNAVADLRRMFMRMRDKYEKENGPNNS